MTSNLNHYEKILSRSHSNYLAQISIEMTDANNQINDVLSKLTALGTVLIPMNLVTGLWGMNVHVPGEDTKDGVRQWLNTLTAVFVVWRYSRVSCGVCGPGSMGDVQVFRAVESCGRNNASCISRRSSCSLRRLRDV